MHLFKTLALVTRSKTAKNARAALCLAICHFQDFHPKSSKSEALKWLIQAAKEDDVVAQSYVKRMHDACEIEMPFELQYIKWLRRATYYGSTVAWLDLQHSSNGKAVAFRPYRIGLEAFSFSSLQDQNQWKKFIFSMHAAQIHTLTTSDGDSLFHYAAASGMDDVLSAFRNKDCNLNCRNKKNMTPLHVACWNGQDQVIKTLLSLGGERHLLAFGDVAPIHFAVASLNTLAVETLIDADCDIHVQSLCSLEELTGIQQSYYSDFSGTALHWAVSRGLVNITKVLLDKGANPVHTNATGLSAISIAARKHDAVLLKILLETFLDASHSAEATAQIRHDVGLEAGSAQLLQPMSCTGKPPLDSFITTLQCLKSIDGKALLSQAINMRSVQVIKYFMDRLPITKTSELTKSYSYGDGTSEVIDLNLNGLLYSSVMFASISLIKLLLSRGADPRKLCLVSSIGGSILHALAGSTSIDSSEDEIVQIARPLLDGGADINAVDPKTKSTPLHAAVNHLKPRLVT